jgi:hypothetical protein
MAVRGLFGETMGDLDRHLAAEAAWRAVAIVTAVVMLLTALAFALTGLSLFTAVSGTLLMLSVAALHFVDIVV